MRLIQSLNKSWKKIDWQKVLSGQIEPLPEQFKVVRLAYRPEGADKTYETRGYWTETFIGDVTFTVEYESGLVHPVTTEVVAWRPLNIKP